MRHNLIRLFALPRRRLCLGWSTLLAGLCALLQPSLTWAHPLGNFSINRYSRLEVGTQQVD